MYLDTLTPIEATVGYGGFGTGGDLGYEGQRVRVRDRDYAHAISTHAPARVRYEIGGRYSSFRCAVAINGDVPAGWGSADFFVYADGKLIASAPSVTAGGAPRELLADVGRAQLLELAVRTNRWNYSHAVWLDPQLDDSAAETLRIEDPLGRAEIVVPAMTAAERCIATVVSPGFDRFLDDMLGSLIANGCCDGARIVVFGVNPDARCEAVSRKYGATLVRCRPLVPTTIAVKAILYSVARVVDARQFVCLDADMLVTGDLSPLFASLHALPPQTILACRDSARLDMHTLADALHVMYDGDPGDTEQLEITAAEGAFPLIANDGIFAGDRAALLAIDTTIRAMPRAREWMEAKPRIAWRNQFIFNLALARLRSGVELDPSYNVQLLSDDATPNARVLHFNGSAKHRYPELRGRYARVARPLISASSGDAYAQFLAALRRWIGTHGVDALAWSFYGTTDGASAHVADTSTFPLFAALHSLIRANGCVRVLETGTARGVSAACLASAVAHRDGGRVVTLDRDAWTERDALWNELPPAMRDRIEARSIDSLDGMQHAIDAGEQYDAVLLDSQHKEEHVWAEWNLARQLVCRGGLILVHDAIWRGGTVEAALARIERAGYGVVRLWTAECGVAEDDRLGLALIENRPQAEGRHS